MCTVQPADKVTTKADKDKEALSQYYWPTLTIVSNATNTTSPDHAGKLKKKRSENEVLAF